MEPSEGVPDRVRRKKLSDKRRHALAIRDDLAWWLWGRSGPMWVYQCAVCATLVQPGLATTGHIKPLSDGGTNDDHNLRLECGPCNVADNFLRHQVDRMNVADRLATMRERVARRRLLRSGCHEIFSNVPVFWKDNLLSYTSRKKAMFFMRAGRAKAHAGGGIALLSPPKDQAPARIVPILNQCARCGVQKGLIKFAQYPSWHLEPGTLRPTQAQRPVCVNCRPMFEIGYGMEITRTAFTTITSDWEERNRNRRRKSLALEGWSRRRSGSSPPQETMDHYRQAFGVELDRRSIAELEAIAIMACLDSNEAERRASKAIADRIMDEGLDFPCLFERIADPAYIPKPCDLPRVPLSIAENEKGNSL